MARTSTVNTYIGEDDCVVVAAYSPGRPGVHTLRNGDPGYPDEPAELEIVSCLVNGKEVDYDDYTEAQWESLQERLMEMAAEAQYADESAYWDNYAKSIKEEA